VRTLRSPDIFSKLTESSKSWIQPVPNMLCMPVPPNTLRIRTSRTLSAASPTVQDRPCPCMANEERGHTHSRDSAFISPTLSGSVPLSDVSYILLRMRRPLSCTQGHAHSLRCLRCLTVTAQLAVRVPRHNRAHSAAMGIWLTGSAWVTSMVAPTSIQPSAVWYSKNEQHTGIMLHRAPKYSTLCVC
jgi:hypothetical protein